MIPLFAFAQGAAAPACVLSLSAPSVAYGNYLTLSWNSQRATAGNITGVGAVGPSGSARVNPGTSGTYTGIFTGAGGTTRCAVSVSVTDRSSTVLGNPGISFDEMSQVQQAQTQVQTQTLAPTAQAPASAQNTSAPPGTYGLVGCNSAATCNFCVFIKLFQNIINFLIGLSIPLSALLFAWAGILYFSSAANPAGIEKAKKIFVSVGIGLLIAMGGWLGVQTILKTLLARDFYVSWDKINCTQTNRPMQESVSRWLSFLPPLNQTPLVPSSIPYLDMYNNTIWGSGVNQGGAGYDPDATYTSSRCPSGYYYTPSADNCFNPDTLDEVDTLYTSPVIGGSGCTNCEMIGGGFAVKNGNQVDVGFNQYLGAFSEELFARGISANDLRITEAWPPTANHSATCHYNGTCTDINCFAITCTIDTINKIQSSASAAGGCAVYETSGSCTGVSGRCLQLPPGRITAPHLSLYQNQTCN